MGPVMLSSLARSTPGLVLLIQHLCSHLHEILARTVLWKLFLKSWPIQQDSGLTSCTKKGWLDAWSGPCLLGFGYLQGWNSFTLDPCLFFCLESFLSSFAWCLFLPLFFGSCIPLNTWVWINNQHNPLPTDFHFWHTLHTEPVV